MVRGRMGFEVERGREANVTKLTAGKGSRQAHTDGKKQRQHGATLMKQSEGAWEIKKTHRGLSGGFGLSLGSVHVGWVGVGWVEGREGREEKRRRGPSTRKKRERERKREETEKKETEREKKRERRVRNGGSYADGVGE